MRLNHLAVFASVAALAACSDAPLTQAEPTDPYDISQVTILKPEQYAANGITATPAPQSGRGAGPSMLIQPEEPCYENCPVPEPQPPPRAYLDYFTSSTKTNNGTQKTLELWTYQQAHNNMESMVLRASYQVVGAQEWKGCGATPGQFDSDYKVAFGAPTELTGSRWASYPSHAAFVWRISVNHTFTAQYGYVVYGTARSKTFPSGHTVCW